MLRPFVLAFPALLAGVTTVARAQADEAFGQVTGVVFDSLLGRPLAGASVWVHGSGRMVLSGTDGRFALNGVAPGARTVGASHPALDSLGLPALAAAVQVRPRAASHVDLVTPGRPSLVRRLCGATADAGAVVGRPRDRSSVGARQEAPGTGMLYGAVRGAAAPPRRPPGALVTAQYVVLARSGRALPQVRTASARTDSAGTYVVCGLPSDVELVVRASAGVAGSGPAYATLGERGVAHLELALDPSALGDTTGAVRGDATLVGVVRDTAGAPRPGARVRVADRPDLEVRADSLGRFALAGLARGTQTLVVSAIGYTPQPTTVDVRGDPTDTAAVVMRRVVQLARVTARGRYDRAGALRDAIARRKRLSMGHIVDSATIERMGTLRAALTTVPFTTVRGSEAMWSIAMWGGGRSITRPSATCSPDVWLDGFPTDGAVLNDLPASSVLAVEVYRRANQAPIQYVLGTRDMCGVVLVWTRSGR